MAAKIKNSNEKWSLLGSLGAQSVEHLTLGFSSSCDLGVVGLWSLLEIFLPLPLSLPFVLLSLK